MTEEELKNIISEQKNLSSISNKILIEHMDKLSTEFDLTKENLIKMTHHLDFIEQLYDTILKEYQSRL